MKKSNKNFNIFRVKKNFPPQTLLYYSEIISRHKRLYSVSNKTNSIKIGLQLYNLTWQVHRQTPAELKNCKLENPSLLFGPVTQNLGSSKRRVLSPCVTYMYCNRLNYNQAFEKADISLGSMSSHLTAHPLVRCCLSHLILISLIKERLCCSMPFANRFTSTDFTITTFVGPLSFFSLVFPNK